MGFWLLLASPVLLSSCITRTTYEYPSDANPEPYAGLDTPYQPAQTSQPYYYGNGNEAQAGSANLAWPRVASSGSISATFYQPTADSWDGHSLAGRSAVAVQSPDRPQPVYGVMTFTATTLVDKSEGVVTLADMHVTRADFPSAPEMTSTYLGILRGTAPQQLKTVPLTPLESSFMAIPLRVNPPPQALDNAPPKIVFSERPALLVSIDGPPAYRPVPGTDLQRVINTRAVLFKDAAGAHYLHSPGGYMTAPSLAGPWTKSAETPDGAALAENQALASAPPETNPEPSTAQPAIIVATSPTELICFNGKPDFAPIPGTQLLYAANTTANIFKLLGNQRTYLLIAGRWYRAASLDGPWQFIPGGQLPRDFANIPDSSPKENVKASVPGTVQANEALIANSIPQSGRIPKTTPMAAPQMDGSPQLRLIEGTPLAYVANSETPIVTVDQNSWYACQNGVWFMGSSVNGPWSVAESIPAAIYDIPVTSPLHYLTYVKIYGENTDSVDEGYTPGYLGTEVAPDGTVVYGTGYDYPPWIGDYWYSPPETWGLGWDDWWTPWWGWGFGCGFGWDWGFGWGCYPFWGPFRGFYGRYGGRFDRFGHAGWANSAGNFYRGGRRGLGGVDGGHGFAPRDAAFGGSFNSRTGNFAAGGRAGVPNSFNAGTTGFSSRSSGYSFAPRNVGGYSRGFGSTLGNSRPMIYGSPRYQSFYGPSGFGRRSFAPGGYRGGGYAYRGGGHGSFGWGGGGFHGGWGGGGGFHGGGGGGGHGGGGGGGGHR